MKKRLRLAMNDLDKQARYYEVQIRHIQRQKHEAVSLKEKQLRKELKRRNTVWFRHPQLPTHPQSQLPLTLRDYPSSSSTSRCSLHAHHFQHGIPGITHASSPSPRSPRKTPTKP
eukprot:CAMPEP_0202711400 /NCGR_PEP_ID=MMETSP1385-20130828/23217_1 /ASSEMBLY_ACC=CAM_ASM_000861 /TAXON_ID=933848 /ORGANISM="Elphidium margaritaceum" /LENGTH=114 /DNA_ID=CAMNT_0049371127 /DNA_START=1 /DNA_END=341 /DNA_ORIENTATION=-